MIILSMTPSGRVHTDFRPRPRTAPRQIDNDAQQVAPLAKHKAYSKLVLEYALTPCALGNGVDWRDRLAVALLFRRSKAILSTP